jgi:putative endonuclease
LTPHPLVIKLPLVICSGVVPPRRDKAPEIKGISSIQMGFVVYILKSRKDNRFYIGQTKDLNMRLEWHELGLVRSTKNRRPLTLIHSEEYGTRSEAVNRESYLKRLKGGNEFKKIISSQTVKD